MKKEKQNTVLFRIWFFADGEKLLGKGRIELLERIEATGSITNAAKAMNMSYRQAWQMVSEINERSNKPLVEKKLGGKSGGGAFVTEAGKKAISIFHELNDKVEAFIQQETKTLKL